MSTDAVNFYAQMQSNYEKRGIPSLKRQGLKGKELQEQIARYYEGIQRDAQKIQNKAFGKQYAKQLATEKAAAKVTEQAAKAAEQTAKVTEQTAKAAEQTAKAGKNAKNASFWAKLGKFSKGKSGKLALGALAIGLLAFGIKALMGDDEKNNPEKTNVVDNDTQPQMDHVDSQDEATPDESGSTPVTPQDEATPVVMPSAPDDNVEPEAAVYTVKKGDNVWNIAKRNLINNHKDVENYRPTNAEIRRETERLIEKNNLKWESDNYRVIILPGQQLNLAA